MGFVEMVVFAGMVLFDMDSVGFQKDFQNFGYKDLQNHQVRLVHIHFLTLYWQNSVFGCNVFRIQKWNLPLCDWAPFIITVAHNNNLIRSILAEVIRMKLAYGT